MTVLYTASLYFRFHSMIILEIYVKGAAVKEGVTPWTEARPGIPALFGVSGWRTNSITFHPEAVSSGVHLSYNIL